MYAGDKLFLRKLPIAWLGFSLFVLLLTITASVQAQTKITGKVTDTQSGESLPGVNISVKGTTTGTSTDENGKYSLDVASLQDTLVFSFIGYGRKIVPINGHTEINVTLETKRISGEELVVVGYGTSKKKNLTSSVSTISSKDLENTSIGGNIATNLQGRAAGVQVQTNSHAPGGGIAVKIRGVSSLTSSGTPLYVVDGIPIATDFRTAPGGDGTASDDNISGAGPPANPLNSIETSNIESIRVLKGPSATAIYGTRGANGVVLINTKRGIPGQQHIDFTSSFGWQKIYKKLDLLDPKQYAQQSNESADENGTTRPFTDQEIANLGAGTNWQDQVFHTAPIQKDVLSFSGGSENIRYDISGSYTDQDGIIKGSNFVRYGANINLDGDVSDKFTIRNSLKFTNYSNRQTLTGGKGDAKSPALIQRVLTASPIIPARNENGELSDFSQFKTGGSSDNPLLFTQGDQGYYIQSNTDRILENIDGEYDIINGLSINSRIGLDLRNWRYDRYAPRGSSEGQAGGRANTLQERTVNFSNINTINYIKTIQKHEIDALGGFSFEQEKDNTLAAISNSFPSDFYLDNNLGNGSDPQPPTSLATKSRLISYFARLKYIFNDTYIIKGTVREDGSSKFGKNNKFGTFPSVSVAWRMANENFIKKLHTFDELKLRASFGVTGNEGIGLYQSQSNVAFDFNDKSGYLFNGQLVPIAKPDNLGNPDLTWEKSREYDVGLDMGLFENRLSFTVDAYIQKTTDLLLGVPIPKQTGFEESLQNIGSIKNKGIELSVMSQNITSKTFNWSTNLNFSINRNKILSLGNVPYINTGDVSGGTVFPFSRSAVRLIPGEPAGTFYGPVKEGIWKSQEQIDQIGTMPGAKPGDIRYKDTNGDGTYDEHDDQIIGNPNPDFTFGFTNDFSFKRVNLHVYIYGSVGDDILNATRRDLINGGGLGIDRLQRWSPQNLDGKYVGAYNDIPGTLNSSLVEDGSYLRAGNITLSYSLPVQKWQNSLRKLQIGVAVDNAFTITGYSGFDPEVNSYGGGRNGNLIQNIDRYAYPLPRTFRVKLNLGL